MKIITKNLSYLFLATFSFFIFTSFCIAQDAVKVDPDHYKVEFENEYVRVLRITYGPGEKSVMHEHPEGVGVILKSGETKMTFPDGKTRTNESKAGQTFWAKGSKHLPQNVGKESSELILIEMKNLTKKKGK